MHRFYDKLEGPEGIHYHFKVVGTNTEISEDENEPQLLIEYPLGPCHPATLILTATQAKKFEAYYDQDIDIVMNIKYTSSVQEIADSILEEQNIMPPHDRYVMQHVTYRIRIEN
jgi:hypothetical protein